MGVSVSDFSDKGFGGVTEMRHRIPHLPLAADATGTFAIGVRDAHKGSMSDGDVGVKVPAGGTMRS